MSEITRRKKNQSEWSLVRFKDDGILFICCSSKTVSAEHTGVKVMWKDGKWYPAVVLKRGGKMDLLNLHYTEKGNKEHFSSTDGNHWFAIKLKKNGSVYVCPENCLQFDDEIITLKSGGIVDVEGVGSKRYLQENFPQPFTLVKNQKHMREITKDMAIFETLQLQGLSITTPTSPQRQLEAEVESDLIEETNGNQEKSYATLMPVPVLIPISFESQQLQQEQSTELLRQEDFNGTVKETCSRPQQMPEESVHQEYEADAFEEDSYDEDDKSESYKPSDEESAYADDSSVDSVRLTSAFEKETQGNGELRVGSEHEKEQSEYGHEEQSDHEYEKEQSEREEQPEHEEQSSRKWKTSFKTYSRKENEDSNKNEDVDVTEEPGNKSLLIATNNNTKDVRVWDKKHACLYCSMKVSKLPRHLERQHANEWDVAKYLNLPPKSKERMKVIEDIRSRGNYKHNMEAIRAGKGEIIVKKRPGKSTLMKIADENKSKKKNKTWVPCFQCQTFVLNENVARHQRISCPGRKSTEDSEGKKKKINRNVQSRCALLLPTPIEIDKDFKSAIFERMEMDVVGTTAINDSLIIQYGARLFAKHRQQEHSYNYISSKIRELSRFLNQMRTIDNVLSLRDCLDASKYPKLLLGVQKLAGFDSQKNTFKIPSLALKTGHVLKKCAGIERGNYIIDGDLQAAESMNNFLVVMERWSDDVSSHALRTLEEKKYNKSVNLPLAGDIQRFHRFLEEEGKGTLQALKTGKPDPQKWDYLTAVLLARVVLFNKRRVGEVEHLKISSYTSRSNEPLNEDVALGLSELERKLCDTLCRIETRGKLGNKVAIILTPQMKEILEALLSLRQSVGISANNPYVFTSSRSSKFIRGSDVIRKFAKDPRANIQYPGRLRATEFRKHIATMAQILNLNENQLKVLAKFLGHSMNVHHAYYRLPEGTLELAKIGKLLVEVEQGNLASLKGKTLDEVGEDPKTGTGTELEHEIEKDEVFAERPNKKNSQKTDDVPVWKPPENFTKNKIKTVRRLWSKEEKSAVLDYLF